MMAVAATTRAFQGLLRVPARKSVCIARYATAARAPSAFETEFDYETSTLLVTPRRALLYLPGMDEKKVRCSMAWNFPMMNVPVIK